MAKFKEKPESQQYEPVSDKQTIAIVTEPISKIEVESKQTLHKES